TSGESPFFLFGGQGALSHPAKVVPVGGIFGRVIYAILLAGVLVTSTWISFSRFALGKSLKVPDLTNLSVEESTALAAEHGLHVVVDAGREGFDDKVPAHRVRAQSPSPETAVKSGQTI